MYSTRTVTWRPGEPSHNGKGPAPAAQALSFGGSVLRLPPVLSRQVGVGGVVLGLLVAHLGTLRTVPGSWSGVVVLMESSFLPGPSAHVRPRVVRHVFAQVGLTDQDLRACVRVSTGVPGASQVDAALGGLRREAAAVEQEPVGVCAVRRGRADVATRLVTVPFQGVDLTPFEHRGP